MKRIVWISPYIPYDKVRHAGGQTHNYYIKKLVQSDKYEVRLISSYLPWEIKDFTLDKSIHCDLICNYDKGIKKLIRNGLDVCRLFNPFDKYGNHKTLYNELMLMHILRRYKKEKYYPDIVIIQWMQSILSLDCVKKVFPEAKIVGIEEDVVVQSYVRKWKNSVGIERWFSAIRLRNIKREEKRALEQCSLIIVNNIKDKKLIEQYGIYNNVKVWAPFYHKYVDINNSYGNKVIYFGDMNRKENHTAARWFIKEVMPLLQNTDITFEVIGSNPPDELKKLENDRVKILGYIADIKPYFSEALCMIAPLSLGAGIKVKVLEGMSAGLPVLTNEIGIEGIPAVKGRDYLFCDSPDEYAAAIKRLKDLENYPVEIGQNARRLLEETVNYERAAEYFLAWIQEL